MRVARFRARWHNGAVLNAGRTPDHVATGTYRGQGNVVLLISETAMRLNAPSPFRMGCTMDAWIRESSNYRALVPAWDNVCYFPRAGAPWGGDAAKLHGFLIVLFAAQLIL